MARKRQRPPDRIPNSKYPFTPDTYPGRRPRFSFFFTQQGIYRLKLRTLDRFLAKRKLPLLNQRFAVLAYGSNASPGQLLRKYQNHGLNNVPVLFGRLVGAEAIYARRTAGNGSYVPATLARKKGSAPHGRNALSPFLPKPQRIPLPTGSTIRSFLIRTAPRVLRES